MLVLGSGPGGQKAAIAAAKLGATVALIERRNMIGGVCIQTGTIPSKTLREAVLYLTGMSQRDPKNAGATRQPNASLRPLPNRSDDHAISHFPNGGWTMKL